MSIRKTGPKTGRRQFLGGLLAAGLIPRPSWADAGSPAFLAAAATRDGAPMLAGIGADLAVAFQFPLPARGHAAAAHPTRPEAVAFARRPGTYAVVIDCRAGAQKALLRAPEGRHFYGHGAFSADGELLFTTENDYEAGQGRIGVWDAAHGYARIEDWASGGIGPHDIKRLPGSEILVVANGGIETHPESGRTKLNIATMRPNLAYLDQGRVLETVSLPEALHKNSIRHLALGREGQVAFGMQWQGAGAVSGLVGSHRRGEAILVNQPEAAHLRDMQGYIGSIAASSDGAKLAVTSPRGGKVQIYAATTLALLETINIADVCGVAVQGDGFTVTSGTGEIRRLGEQGGASATHANLMWDNHLIAL